MDHLEKLKDLTCAQEYAVTVSRDTLDDREELWDTLKRETLEAAKACIVEYPRSRSDFTSVEIMESIEESHAARIAGDHDYYRVVTEDYNSPEKRQGEVC